MYANVESSTGFTGSSLLGGQSYILSAAPTTGEATALTNMEALNFQGWLPGVASYRDAAENVSSDEAGAQQPTAVPTLAIVTYYDTFSVVPELPRLGLDSAQVVAFFELLRLFARLYENPRTQGRYNLLFVLTSGGSVNFDGARAWISQADSRLLDNIELVLCLDAIGRTDSHFYMHSSRVQTKDSNVKALAEV
jgi:hypothetical protein